jgi:hypothetical protein
MGRTAVALIARSALLTPVLGEPTRELSYFGSASADSATAMTLSRSCAAC